MCYKLEGKPGMVLGVGVSSTSAKTNNDLEKFTYTS